MQMVLVVITGHCLASTKLIDGWITKTASKANTPSKAVLTTLFVSFIAAWLNWGFGLVIGALIAKKIAAKQENVDFPIMVAAAYAGALGGMFGLSITAPLLINTPGHFLESQIGLIPVTETIFHPSAIIINIVMILLTALAFKLMIPTKKDEIRPLEKNLLGHSEEELSEKKPKVKTLAYVLENSSIISYVVGLAGIIIIVNHFMTNGLDLNINIVNFIFLILGIILHRTPINYVNAVGEAISSIQGVVLQFPFYAGIMGMMSGSGLVTIIANWITSFSTVTSFPFLTYVQVGLVNLFVPSAGGQWMVQGPILVNAGEALGVPHNLTAIAYSFGDLSTNLIQPFWALPVLGIANLKMKDIWGYCLIAYICFFIVTSLGLTFLPW